MSRKSVFVALGIVGVLFLGGGITLAAMLRYQPEFYRRAEVPAGEVRKQRSGEFRSQFYSLLSDIKNYKVWAARFTDVQTNSYFEEDYLKPGNFERTLFPEGANAPRVVIENDRLRMGWRYGTGIWSTIISVDLRVWLAANEPNVVIVEIERIRAGAVPITAQSILDKLSEALRRQEIEVTWYRREGKPAALLRFGAGRQEMGVQLLHLKLQPGIMTINGADRSKPAGTDGEVTATGTTPAAN